MNEFDRWMVRLAKVVAFALLLLLFLAAVSWWLHPPRTAEERVVVQFTEEEKCWLNQRFRYHGISSCVCENGEFYFYRNGQRCKL